MTKPNLIDDDSKSYAWNAGAEAYRAGMAFNDTPYPIVIGAKASYKRARTQWFLGWLDAKYRPLMNLTANDIFNYRGPRRIRPPKTINAT